jgi:hypothetical protein
MTPQHPGHALDWLESNDRRQESLDGGTSTSRPATVAIAACCIQSLARASKSAVTQKSFHLSETQVSTAPGASKIRV